jgi:hypothetical protein
MEVLRDLRTQGDVTALRRILLAIVVSVMLGACAGPQAPIDPQKPIIRGPNWPVKSREHVDLWLHGYALLLEDTATVPIFARDYRTLITIEKNKRAVYTPFDSLRSSFAATLRNRPALEGAQFLALYFGSWEEMRQAFDYFLKAEGDANRSGNREVAGIVAFLAQQYPRAEDRAFAKKFLVALEAERAAFFHDWWVQEQRARMAGLAAFDERWQSTWRPALQPYLNYTKQNSGDLLVSMVLGGEGRAVPAGKQLSQYAVAWPRTADSAEVALFVFAHEAAGAVATVAINDHLTPVQQREGMGTRLAPAGLVRGGALLVERIDPSLGEKYARWYLAQAGKPVPATDALAALAEAFPMPAEMIESMRRQIRAAGSGI